ncbi:MULTISPECIES: hypothetical protein [unclassified Acinetobacter]|uniref:hypothetical protein n=1 Tax=unclassified Acinetobacter TaxID=196816 RepID=UPI000B3CACA0|nr:MULTISPECIES: hypothetical protein [unclassified Acinetobacter]AVZ85165.1 hypothetical protein CDG55_04950 [Acinetobacter sp. WCHA45]MCL5768201.1 hypothetical protein [Acinetobacter sp. ANC5681]
MLGFFLDFITICIIGFNLILLFKFYKGNYPSKIALNSIGRDQTPFPINKEAQKLEEELVNTGFSVIGYSFLDNTYVMFLKHTENNISCLIYLNDKYKKVCYEFYLKPLIGKEIFIESCDMPMTFEHLHRDLYRIPANLTPTLVYLSILNKIGNDVLDNLPTSIDKFLEIVSDYFSKDAEYQTQRGFLSKMKAGQEFQKISLMGAFVLLFRSGFPTGFYFSYKELNRFNKKFLGL